MDKLRDAWKDGYEPWMNWGDHGGFKGMRPDNPYDCEEHPDLWNQWETGVDDAGWDS